MLTVRVGTDVIGSAQETGHGRLMMIRRSDQREQRPVAEKPRALPDARSQVVDGCWLASSWLATGRLCYVRGPEGVVVELAEQLS
jgi:hypothetical protein